MRKVGTSFFLLKKWLFLTLIYSISDGRNKNLRPLFDTNIPAISGNYAEHDFFAPPNFEIFILEISAKCLNILHQHFFRALASPVDIVCSRGLGEGVRFSG